MQVSIFLEIMITRDTMSWKMVAIKKIPNKSEMKYLEGNYCHQNYEG